MMRGYAETPRCRRQYLLNYFGEPYEPPCGACDTCRSGRAASVEDAPPIAIGARVHHERFGEGTVTGYEDGRLTAVYGDGYRTVLADDAMERGLLRAVD
jgi:ATP-dependent DNA helicase RecQ